MRSASRQLPMEREIVSVWVAPQRPGPSHLPALRTMPRRRPARQVASTRAGIDSDAFEACWAGGSGVAPCDSPKGVDS